MPGNGHVFFDTALGRCGLAFTASGVAVVRLPRLRPEDVAALAAVGPRAVAPPFVESAIRALTAHLAGEDAPLDEVPLDLSGVTPFRRKVYELSREIPRGEVVSYGELAARLGKPGGARAVGQALAHNPLPLLVPCHRILGAAGDLHGFTAPGGLGTKRRLLGLEGASAGA